MCETETLKLLTFHRISLKTDKKSRLRHFLSGFPCEMRLNIRVLVWLNTLVETDVDRYSEALTFSIFLLLLFKKRKFCDILIVTIITATLHSDHVFLTLSNVSNQYASHTP